MRWTATNVGSVSEKSYRAMVYGEGPTYTDPMQAIVESYEKSVFDEFVMPTVIVDDDGKPVGLVESGDAVIFFNFRPDRAIQLSKSSRMRISAALIVVLKSPKNLYFVCLTLFSETVDGFVAYKPKNLDNTLGEVLAQNGLEAASYSGNGEISACNVLLQRRS